MPRPGRCEGAGRAVTPGTWPRHRSAQGGYLCNQDQRKL